MSYDQLWKSTKESALVTWSVMSFLGLAFIFGDKGMLGAYVPLEPSRITYFFGALQSSAFAVFYINNGEWSFRRFSDRGSSPSEL